MPFEGVLRIHPWAADARLDPWAFIPSTDGDRVLFGYAEEHPVTGGRSWLRTTSVQWLDLSMHRAVTASERLYDLDWKVRAEAVPGEGADPRRQSPDRHLHAEAVGMTDELLSDGAAPGQRGPFLEACAEVPPAGIILLNGLDPPLRDRGASRPGDVGHLIGSFADIVVPHRPPSGVRGRHRGGGVAASLLGVRLTVHARGSVPNELLRLHLEDVPRQEADGHAAKKEGPA